MKGLADEGQKQSKGQEREATQLLRASGSRGGADYPLRDHGLRLPLGCLVPQNAIPARLPPSLRRLHRPRRVVRGAVKIGFGLAELFKPKGKTEFGLHLAQRGGH